MSGNKRSALVLAGFVALFLGLPTGSHAQRQAAVQSQLSTNVLFAAPQVDPEVICQHCEEASVEWMNVTYFEHRFIGDCTASFAALGTTKSGVPIVAASNVTSGAGAAVFESGGCRRCGGTSRCHPGWESGECHIECGSGGGESLALQIAEAVRTKSYGQLSKLIANSQSLASVNLERSAIPVRGCKGNLIAHVPVAPTTSLSLAMMQSQAAPMTHAVSLASSTSM